MIFMLTLDIKVYLENSETRQVTTEMLIWHTTSNMVKALYCKVYFHPKTSQSHVWEDILLLKTISLISYGILFHGHPILKTISQLKQKWTNEWKQTWQLAI